jgi:glycine cleavage system aminomethyltransferase T
VIIRVLHRGGGRVARRLVRLQIQGDVPQRGAKVFSGDREIGFVTSAAESPRLGAIGLAYLHRDFVEGGSEVQVDLGELRERAIVAG